MRVCLIINNFKALYKDYVLINNVFVAIKKVFKNKIERYCEILKFCCNLNIYKIIKKINRVVII